MTRLDAAEVRRYLLGAQDDRAWAALERQYFEDPDTLDEISALEDDLIEDYLAGRLESSQARQFEQHYLATARHRARLETTRRLLSADGGIVASPSRLRAAQSRFWWASLGAAAAIALLAAGTAWLARNPSAPASPSATAAPPAPAAGESAGVPAATPARRVFAFSLAAVTVRSAADRPSLVIPDGVDVVSLDLQRDTAGARQPVARAIVRTIGGDEVWNGPASIAGSLPPDVAARVEIPAARLPPDDYTVSLLATDRQGGEYEDRSYFLSVRAR